MALLNKHPSTDTLQRLMSTFKQFEKKLDNLQNAVSYHGQTLNDLRFLMTNLSGGGGVMTSGSAVCSDDPFFRRPIRMSAAIQYEPQIEPIVKKRKRPIVQLPPKNTPVKAKLFQPEDVKLFPMPFQRPSNDFPKQINTKNRSQKIMRHSKVEMPWKGSFRRGKNELVRKRNIIPKKALSK